MFKLPWQVKRDTSQLLHEGFEDGGNNKRWGKIKEENLFVPKWVVKG